MAESGSVSGATNKAVESYATTLSATIGQFADAAMTAGKKMSTSDLNPMLLRSFGFEGTINTELDLKAKGDIGLKVYLFNAGSSLDAKAHAGIQLKINCQMESLVSTMIGAYTGS